MAMERDPAARPDPERSPTLAVQDLVTHFGDIVPQLAERAEEYRADGDAADAETWALFETEVWRALARLDAGCAAHAANVIRDRGHSFEGMGGTVGLPELSVVGAELSLAARAEDWERCARLTQRLRAWANANLASGGEA